MIKKFKSIDGQFEGKIGYKCLDKNLQLEKKYSLLGSGNSISALPYNKNSIIVENNRQDNIFINKKKLELTASGGSKIYEIYNKLQIELLYFPSFPSYPLVTLGGCIANNVHGLNPSSGVISKFIKKIKIYNPNFGYKVLSPKKNSNLFYLTIGGMGLTGVIVEATISVFKLKSTYIKTKTFEIDNLLDGYNFLKKSKNFYNQNNFFFNVNKKCFCRGVIKSGNFIPNKISIKKLIVKKISNFRLGFFRYKIFLNFFSRLLILLRLNCNLKVMHINNALFPSNNKVFYFNLMTKKFIEFQTIIPHKNVKKYFEDFENIVKKTNPTITLCHLKIFSGKPRFLQFDGAGLGFSIHVLTNNNFNFFYKKLLKLNDKFKCNINIYKNSLVNLNIIKNFSQYNRFKKNIIKLNRNCQFTNKIFNNSFYENT